MLYQLCSSGGFLAVSGGLPPLSSKLSTLLPSINITSAKHRLYLTPPSHLRAEMLEPEAAAWKGHTSCSQRDVALGLSLTAS